MKSKHRVDTAKVMLNNTKLYMIHKKDLLKIFIIDRMPRHKSKIPVAKNVTEFFTIKE